MIQILQNISFQALLLETPCWKNVSTIELIDTGLSDFALGRLSRLVFYEVVHILRNQLRGEGGAGGFQMITLV